MTTVADLCHYLETFAPCSLAEEWDNVGLLLGDGAVVVERVITCLTITPEVVREAVEAGVGLIVSHHPILFRAAKRITTRNVEGRMLWEMARAGVAVYSPHTAFDNTQGGINDHLASLLGLQEVEPLQRGAGASRYKLVVFVPEGDLQRVSDALFAAGAGLIGNYSQCSFRIPGTGTFFGSAASNPTVGRKGQREEVAESRLEVLVPEKALDEVVRAMRQAHSHEEPAFDVYPLKSGPSSSGAGRVGRLPEAMPLESFARRVKEIFRTPVLQYHGDPAALVRKAAIVCGAGGGLMNEVVRAGADVFLTGELRFHESLSALAQNLAVVLPGHYASERIAVEALAERLQQAFPAMRIEPSRQERDPSRWV